ncbi:MAG: hypothetical protein GEV28_13770 [Actinophytocola sp.]|uniref:hypothetical protein n=1 Tax=Actinophytocola sp. TaxID=1872138 RepID=UPI00132BE051|nr:hypothetical protein [Actinophytocola sp.]MPZ81404.1 hypothetical protein [Actinophytocola sp.]
MHEELVVSSWVGIRASCEMNYSINTCEDVDFMISGGNRTFEFAYTVDALRKFVELSGVALAEMDALRELEEAELGAQPAAVAAS